MTVSQDVKHNLLTRLRRIEGQTRGIQRMIELGTSCVDILNQIAGVQGALEQVSLQLMERHLASCVSDAVCEGQGEEKIREIMQVLKYYTRT
ncbi:MAG TPA: metal-sensitive transcriptional regulator [Ktedonobacteraceae bacterium]|nr:metal-sensitive transcriptional regulator [Ktedonobacteraceae bacterium]